MTTLILSPTAAELSALQADDPSLRYWMLSRELVSQPPRHYRNRLERGQSMTADAVTPIRPPILSEALPVLDTPALVVLTLCCLHLGLSGSIGALLLWCECHGYVSCSAGWWWSWRGG